MNFSLSSLSHTYVYTRTHNFSHTALRSLDDSTDALNSSMDSETASEMSFMTMTSTQSTVFGEFTEILLVDVRFFLIPPSAVISGVHVCFLCVCGC